MIVLAPPLAGTSYTSQERDEAVEGGERQGQRVEGMGMPR